MCICIKYMQNVMYTYTHICHINVNIYIYMYTHISNMFIYRKIWLNVLPNIHTLYIHICNYSSLLIYLIAPPISSPRGHAPPGPADGPRPQWPLRCGRPSPQGPADGPWPQVYNNNNMNDATDMNVDNISNIIMMIIIIICYWLLLWYSILGRCLVRFS